MWILNIRPMYNNDNTNNNYEVIKRMIDKQIDIIEEDNKKKHKVSFPLYKRLLSKLKDKF